jgi:hypothetical protein
VCFSYDPNTHQCTSYRTNAGSTAFSPPFAYSYQCSAAFVTYYAPAFLYMSLAASFVSPLAQALLCWLHRRAMSRSASLPSSQWFRLLGRVLPPALHPLGAIPVPRNLFRPYFDAGVLQTNLVIYVALTMTFGAVFPPLAAALLLTAVAVVLIARVKVGYLIRSAREAGAEWALQVLQQECGAVCNVLPQEAVLWALVTLSCWFYTLFLFDTLGDAVGFQQAYWVLIVVPLLPLCLYGSSALVRRKDVRCGGAGGDVKADRDSELVTAVVASPLTAP